MSDSLTERLNRWIGEVVVLDCISEFVAIGTLVQATPTYVELADADLHDLRDTDTTRELYLVKTARHGVQANRRTLVFRMDQAVAVTRLADVVAG